MLDVHIAVHPRTPPQWAASCIDSVIAAAELAPFDVQVHIIDAQPSVGLARQMGYARGTAPYVTHVDDDDYVMPEAFACLADGLGSRPLALFTDEAHRYGDTLTPGMPRHHLAVYRRDVMADVDFAAWPHAIDRHLRARAESMGPVIDVPESVYVWRVRTDSPARLASTTAMERARA